MMRGFFFTPGLVIRSQQLLPEPMTMRYTLAINGAPGVSQASLTAYQFAQTVLAEGHQIYRIFFYQDGVHNGSAFSAPPQDELDLTAAWQKLAGEHQLDLVVCIAAALRRGVLNQTEAERYSKPGANLAAGFEISGLGQLVEAAAQSDHLISFGAH